MYTLMNKDVKLLDFIIKGEGILEECYVVNKYRDIPSWIVTVTEWVANRSAAKHRKHIHDYNQDVFLTNTADTSLQSGP